ncbi:MAG: hypothetical protein K8L97_08265 [Anaerolineae bacterium]|nr:hypothetical protein [Anaerolineae bacterium]
MTFPARLAYTLLTAYILTFYSEWMFWTGRPPSPTFFLEALPTWMAYSFITFFFITAVGYFRVRSLWVIFLCGALYGWLLEGVLVQTLYDAFPIQISFTGLAWHALISVLFGWWWLPRRLHESRAIIPCLLFGLGLGLWSIGWWLEPDVAVAAPESVFLYNGFFSLLLVPAYMLWSRFKLADFRPTRIEVIGALVLLALYFAVITVPTQPLALLVLPPLLTLVLWILRKNRQHEPEIQIKVAPITLKKALPLLLIPVTASLVYAGALSIGLTFPGLQVLYTITMPLGFILFAISLYKTGFQRRELDRS